MSFIYLLSSPLPPQLPAHIYIWAGGLQVRGPALVELDRLE